ncbi:phenylalanine--tRNA ligase subunit beta [Dinghuibacter silviterrae]|uniref:Phenylalanine--tRNA ligase beta subunit n=1 Tax=Dinghuibacter silviterrae TaxID=1539049 RepID=A0A4R8DQZ3_9BACT|nr:phenylalanine--tRNA ligase subunit beta [Dinghuibacter silviterrae]TDX00218.1 phenylalanyl-tRNA synthetase beta subunit [Dinghuibacter silviterrae]
MTISYHWLHDYLPVRIDPERLSNILTSIGLEVESLHLYEEVPGNLGGLITGKVLACDPHPNADKLKVTQVDTGSGDPLQIVCGASNVAKGQAVVVALPGVTIHPVKGEPLTLKVTKIRGVESHGMLCAEDEIGWGESHAGIMVLPENTVPGTPLAQLLEPYTDWVYEIGLTPNRMDAMSHLGTARDVCAYLTHHEGKPHTIKSPFTGDFKPDDQSQPIAVNVENTDACRRYSGVSLKGLQFGPAPKWMRDRLKAIGVRPISNIVDITNYILHETGQPLHAFDRAHLKGGKIIVKNLPEGTPFTTLDGKERKLSAEDLMICDAEGGVCIAGVYGGLDSGVSDQTKDIFLESAWFDPATIRKTSFRHGLRTDAALRFEKGVDISNTKVVLQRAAQLIKEVANGKISSNVIDIYPKIPAPVVVTLDYSYLHKLSGKAYPKTTAADILKALGFKVEQETGNSITVAVPTSKTDIRLPADLVEEIMRIDGLDNIEIPAGITITPAVEADRAVAALKEKAAGFLVGLGFNEIMTNSISNSAWYGGYDDKVALLNSLSSELDVMRPSMLETGLEVLAYNLNRKNLSLKMFEFGKTYGHDREGKGKTPFRENDHLCLYLTGAAGEDTWHHKATPVDLYYAKGATEALLKLCGIAATGQAAGEAGAGTGIVYLHNGHPVARTSQVPAKTADRFGIRQPVFFVDIDWGQVTALYNRQPVKYREVARFPSVQRDLAMVMDEGIAYDRIKAAAFGGKLKKLRSVDLFDVFRSDKIGAGKKSVALAFTFQDEEKTLTDKEIDAMMQQLAQTFSKELGAEVRK